LAKA
jgi:hypothetical protein